MYRYRIDPIAQIELEEAGNTYIRYFAGLGDIHRGEVLAEAFLKVISTRFSNSSKCPSCTRFAMSTHLMTVIRQATVAFVLVGSRFSIQSKMLG